MEAYELRNAIYEGLEPLADLTAPHVLYRPRVIATTNPDASPFMAMHDETRITTFGDTPKEALRRFDIAWGGGKCGARLADPIEIEKPATYAEQQRAFENDGKWWKRGYCELPATHLGLCSAREVKD